MKLFMLVGLLSGILFSAQGQSVSVINGGFEEEGVSWSGSGIFTKEEKHGGERSLLLKHGFSFQPLADLIKISPKFDYKISIWIKALNMKNSLATLTAVCRGEKNGKSYQILGKWLAGNRSNFNYEPDYPALIAVGETPEWTLFEIGIPAKQINPQAKYLSLYLRNDVSTSTSGKVYYDDLTIEKLPMGTLKSQKKASANVVLNPGFEQGKLGWRGSGLTISNKKSAIGKKSLKISSGYAMQGMALPKTEKVALRLKVKAENCDPDSIYAQLSYRGSGVKGAWRGPVYNKIKRHTELVAFTTGGDHDWKDINVVLPIPANAEKLYLYLRKTGPGIAYFDDIKLIQTEKSISTAQDLRKKGFAPEKPLAEDIDFVHDKLENSDFSKKLDDWLSEGLISTKSKGGPENRSYLSMQYGSVMQGIKVKASSFYQVSALTKSIDMGIDVAQIKVLFKAGSKKIGRPKNILFSGENHGWKKIQTIVESPVGATSATFIIKKGFDDGIFNITQMNVKLIDKKDALITTSADAYKKLMPIASEKIDYQAVLQSLKKLAKNAPSGKITLVEDGKTNYTIYASSQNLIETRTITLPKGYVLKKVDYSLLHAQKMTKSGDFQRIPVNIDLKNIPLKSLKISIEVKSDSVKQSYLLGVRLKNDKGKFSGWLGGHYERGSKNWSIRQTDLSAKVIAAKKKGFSKIVEIYLRPYCKLGNVPYLINSIKLTLNGRNVYFNDFEKGKRAFSNKGGGLVSKIDDCAGNAPLFRLSDGKNPPVFGSLFKERSIFTNWRKPSGIVTLGISHGWHVGISGFTLADSTGRESVYKFEDIKQKGAITGKHSGIDFGAKQWDFFEAPGLKNSEIANGQHSGKLIRFSGLDKPQTMEFYAAEEMAKYLQDISGAKFTPFANDANPSVSPLLIIGRNNLLVERLDPTIPYDELGEEGFVIRTVGPHIIITGANPRGTLYGVYWFLDHLLGVRWFSKNYTYIPKKRTLRLNALNELRKPRYTYRELFWRDGDDESYRAHNLLNGKSHHRISKQSIPGLNNWSTQWSDGGHNFHKAVPQKKLHGGGQLLMMNKQTRISAAKYLEKRLKAKKTGSLEWLGLSQMDHGWRPDPASLKFMASHGGAKSAPIIDMVLDVARRVRKEFPNAKFATMVYQWSLPAPTGIKIPDYLQITFAPIRTDYSQPYNGPRNAAVMKDIQDWAKIAKNIVVWDYSATNFAAYSQPHPTLDSEFESIQWLATMPSIKGYFGQGAMGSIGAEFANLRQWVAARLLWNPKQDWRKLVKEFVMGYYGKAGPYILEYIDLMHAAKKKADCKLQFKTPVMSPFLTFETLKKADELFTQAENAVSGETGVLRRVKTARIGVDAVILLRRGDYKYEAKEKGIAWDPDTEARLARLKTNAGIAGITLYGEGTGRIKDVLLNMKVERSRSTPVDIVNGLPRDEWIEVQDLGLKLMVRCNVVGDKLASDGGAVTMKGNTGAWGIQLTMDFLPAGGKWKLYVEVRAEPEKDAAEDTKAIVFGVYPGPNLAIEAGAFKDGKYHIFAVPGIYESNAGQTLWFAPPNSKAIKAIYVDRVVAIKISE